MAKMQPFWYFLPPPCPSGEQILDGGFESVNPFVYWTRSSINVKQTSYTKHSGIYSCEVPKDEWILQTLTEAILVKCVESFTLWHQLGFTPYPLLLVVTITYTDNSTTVINVYGTDGYWHELNIKPYLTVGKAIKQILCSYPVSNPSGTCVSLDDVSLIGSGE